MKKILFSILLALLVATPVSAYVIQKGDTPFGLWGSNWKEEMSQQIGHTDQYNLPVGVDVNLYGEILGGTPTPTSSASIKYVEAPDFYAYSPAVAGDTTITINDLEDIYGNTLTMADFGNIGYGRIDPDGAEVSESFTFTGVTANSDGTYTLTGVKSVLAKYPYTQTSGLVRSHSINAIVRFTNTASFYDNFANKENNEIIDGSWSFLNNTFSIGDGANTNKTFKFNNGATNTPEMVYDATNNQLKFRRSGETSYTEIPLSLRGTYANYASLPTDASNGDIAITTDDYKLYTYNATGVTWVLAGGSSGAGTVYKTEKLGSESDGGDLKTFTLTAGSWPSSNFLLVYKNGQLQSLGASNDYTEVDSNTIEFTYELATDDLVSMVVVSVDLYNPAWGVVNGSIIPDTDNAYDLGTATKTFKDVYVTGTLYYKGNTPIPEWTNTYFGDGTDGDVTISVSTTLTEDKQYNNLTINSGVVVNTGGYRIFVKGTLTNNGTIHRNGNSASGSTGGAALASGTVFGSYAGQNGNSSGAAGTAGTAGKSIVGAAAAAGGSADNGNKAGGAAGSLTLEYATFNPYFVTNTEFVLQRNNVLYGTASLSLLSSAPGAGSGASVNSLASGGAGSAGGVVYIAAANLINNGSITSNGGNGGDGTNDTYHGTGGGGGGNGGLIVLIYKELTAGTITANGGTGGAGKSGDSTSGSNGENGGAGATIKIKI